MTKKPNIYLNELRLKSYLIRTKNMKNNHGTLKWNRRINQLIETYIRLLDKGGDSGSKKASVRNHVKARIIKLSEITQIDEPTYNDFAKAILMTIKKILTKPQFSGYTYKDDFYSDSTYKILKYINNFDHTLTSKISGQMVNSFAYITQIIHNSIIYVISENKKYQESLKNEYDRKRTILNISKKQYFNDDRDFEQEKTYRNKYLNSVEDLEHEVQVIKDSSLDPSLNEISYFISDDLYNAIQNNAEIFNVYTDLQESLFTKSMPSRFYRSNKEIIE